MDVFGNKIYYKLPEENDNGNVEYKWCLKEVSNNRRIEIITQMNWRVHHSSDKGSVLYVVGIHDEGSVTGLEIDDLKCTIINLMDYASELKLRFCIRWVKKVSEHEKRYWSVVQIFIPGTIPDHPIPDYLQV